MVIFQGDLATAIHELAKCKHGVALTGAGLSLASGIPTFRGKGGLWEKYDPLVYAHIQCFLHEPEKLWQMQKELLDVILPAKPNKAHEALVTMERMKRLACIITQNVDGLHTVAGSLNVLEFHGNKRRLVCLNCSNRYPSERYLEQCPPRCECGAILKPDVVLFGEQIPIDVLMRSRSEASQADLLLVAGTSAVVSPASDIPILAKNSGCFIIEINPEITPLTGYVSDLFLQGPTEEILPMLVEGLQSKTNSDRTP